MFQKATTYAFNAEITFITNLVSFIYSETHGNGIFTETNKPR